MTPHEVFMLIASSQRNTRKMKKQSESDNFLECPMRLVGTIVFNEQ